MPSSTTEVETDPLLEKRTRRRFSGADKKRLLEASDSLPHGEKGAWLRRNGLYAGQLSTWRRELTENGLAGLSPKTPGRKPMDARDRRIEHLERANAKLERQSASKTCPIRFVWKEVTKPRLLSVIERQTNALSIQAREVCLTPSTHCWRPSDNR